MVPLATDELVRPLGIIHRRGKELGSTTRRFIELLQSGSARRIAPLERRRNGTLSDSTAHAMATAARRQRASWATAIDAARANGTGQARCRSAELRPPMPQPRRRGRADQGEVRQARESAMERQH